LETNSEVRQGKLAWWRIHRPRTVALFNAPKLVLRQTADTIYAAVDLIGYYCLNSIIIVQPKHTEYLKYYVGLLNSRLIRWLYRNLTQEQSRVFAEVKPINVRKLPIRKIDFSSQKDNQIYENIISLVDLVMELNKRKYENPGEELLSENITEALEKIDLLVYALYNLSKEDISIIEGKSQ
jgi:adenine-specific DNA-methyltransferase